MSDTDRKQRLAAALRENLKRRKAQARGTVADSAPDDSQRQEIHVPAWAAISLQP